MKYSLKGRKGDTRSDPGRRSGTHTELQYSEHQGAPFAQTTTILGPLEVAFPRPHPSSVVYLVRNK